MIYLELVLLCCGGRDSALRSLTFWLVVMTLFIVKPIVFLFSYVLRFVSELSSFTTSGMDCFNYNTLKFWYIQFLLLPASWPSPTPTYFFKRKILGDSYVSPLNQIQNHLNENPYQ